MTFKATEAAFEGFRLIRREPKTIAAWAVAALVLGVALALGMIATGFGGVLEAPTPESMTPQWWGKLLAFEGVAILGTLVTTSIMGAAVYRAVLRPEEAPRTRLRLGPDELRLTLLSVIMAVIFTVLSVLLMIPVGVIIVAIAAGSGGFQSSPDSGATLGVIAAVLLAYLLLLLGLSFFAVRLSLAGALTFAERRLNVFGSWRLTKGKFWKLLGCYLLVLVMLIPFYMVMMAVYGGVTFAFSGGDLGRAMSEISRPDLSSIKGYFNASRTVYLVVVSIFSGAMYAVMFAPAAAIYRDLAGQGPESKADVFS
ncbi:MAG: hypothetical protein J7521_16285 [Caulobacter sp.]|nr:hypothetical protein [Caulobacter sp.]